MAKCPSCGNTETYIINNPVLSDNGAVLTEQCRCTCGCLFFVDYERNLDGYWEHSWTEIIEN